MKNSIIYIKYLDSVFYDGELLEDHNYKLVIFDAVGFLIKEDAEAVYISREINTTHGNKRRAVIGIPKVAILEKRIVGEVDGSPNEKNSKVVTEEL